MILAQTDGFVAKTEQDATQAVQAGYQKCATMKDSRRGGVPCPFYLSPEAQAAVTSEGGGYYTCPVCLQSHDLLHTLPWHGVDPEVAEDNARYDQDKMGYFSAGGGTRIGLTMAEQGEIGESLVRNLGEIPGYGPITWWHEGGPSGNSPLDGATKDWGVEVKTLSYDTQHHRYVPGRVKEKDDKNRMALSMGKKGILGVLVLLDYRRSVADIYVKEHPVTGGEGDTIIGGTKAFRSNTATHLVREVSFRNPLLDPASPSPQVNTTGAVDNAGELMAF